MKQKRRKFSATFKAQVAIEALKERESLAELSKRFELHPTMTASGSRNSLKIPPRYLIKEPVNLM